MNVLDRAINFVAPRYGLRRTQARMALELTEGYLERHASRFSYDVASAGRGGLHRVGGGAYRQTCAASRD
jgi:hypothetical protein